MPLTLGLGTVTDIWAEITMSGFAADGTVEMQAAVRPDFKNCVCPIITGIALTSPYYLLGLTQNTPYYLRARSRRASGVAEAWSGILTFKTPLTTAPDLSTPAVLISPAMLVVPVPIVEWTGLGNGDLAGYPCSNLGFDAPVPWRTLPSAGTTVQFQARMAPQPVDTIAVLMTNMPEGATIRVKAGNTSAVSDYTSATIPFRASANLAGRPGWHGILQLPAPQTYPYWRVTMVVATGLPIAHIEHAVFGLNRASKNHSVDKVEQPLDLGSFERSRNGVPRRMLGLRGKRVDFEIAMVNQLQFETLYADLPRLVGTTSPVLVVPNSKTGAFLHDRILYGVMVGGRASNPASPVYSRTFTIDSILP